MEGTDVKPRSSAVKKIVEAIRPKHEPEVQAANENYDEARARSREAPMLEIRFPDGRLASFDYARLAESEFLPEGKIILRFGRKEVIAEGKNLLRLYTTLTERRQRFICVGTDEEEASKPEDAQHIDRITIRAVPEDQV